MGSPLRQYAFINAKLRARISRLLPEPFLERLLRSADLTDALHILSEGPYAELSEVYQKTGDLRMVELALFGREVGLSVEIEDHVEGSVLGMVQAMAARYEVEVLKNTLRLWFEHTIRGRPVETSYLYRIPIHRPLPLDSIIAATDAGVLPSLLQGTPYAQPVSEGLEGLDRGTLFPIEIALDKWFYSQLIHAAEALSSRDRVIADRMIGVEIDLQNTAWVVRLKSFYDLPVTEALGYLIPHGHGITSDAVAQVYEQGRVTDLVAGLVDRRYPQLKMILGGNAADEHSRLLLIERILGQIVLLEVRRVLGGYPFTVGVIMAYLVLERSEIQTLITILNAKLYGMDQDRIRGEL